MPENRDGRYNEDLIFKNRDNNCQRSVICCCFLFKKFLKRDRVHFWYVCKCFTAALLFYYDVLGTLTLPIKGWDVIFLYFLGEKSPARVAKVPAIAGSRLLF